MHTTWTPNAPVWNPKDLHVPIYIDLYTRVSSSRKESRSCEDQEAELRFDVVRYVQRSGEPIVVRDILSDPHVSASRYNPEDRPNWCELIRRIQCGETRLVGFWEMSRSTRNWREWADFSEVAEDQGVHVFLRGRMYDCADPHDLSYLTQQVTRGIEEVAETRERTLRSKRRDAERGRPGTGPVFGLMSVYDERTGALITHAPDHRPWPRDNGPWTPAGLVQEAAARVLAGESRRSVCLDWNEKGIPSKLGKDWNAVSLDGILRSTSIMGKRTHMGTLINEGGWEGLISEEDFAELQRVFERARKKGKVRDRSVGLKYYCTSLAQCGVCGNFMTSALNRSRISYACKSMTRRRGGCVTRATHVLDSHVEALIVAELSRPDVLLRFEKPVDRAQIERDCNRVAELEAQMEDAYRESLKPGVGRLPMGQLMQIRASLQAEVDDIRVRIADAEEGAPSQVRRLAGIGPDAILSRWREFTPEQKRSLARDVTDSVHVLPVGRVGPRKLLPSESVDVRFRGDPPFELLGG